MTACVEETGSAKYVANVTQEKEPSSVASMPTTKARGSNRAGLATLLASVADTVEPTCRDVGEPRHEARTWAARHGPA